MAIHPHRISAAKNGPAAKNSIQISRIRRSSSYVMKRPHYHSYYEIYYLLSGQCRMFIDQDIYYLKPGDAVIIPPLQIHRALYEEGLQAERYDMYFTKEEADAFHASCGREGFERVFLNPRIAIPQPLRPGIEGLLSHLSHENGQEDAYSHVQQQSLLFQILVLIGRCQDTQQEKDSLNDSEAAIVKAAQYINLQYREHLTLDAMAAMSNMSPTYFSRKFRASTGFCFKEYVNYIRVQKASDLLRNTDGTVTSIAIACGFSDGNYFGDVFKKLTGLSPREYRNGIRGDTVP